MPSKEELNELARPVHELLAELDEKPGPEELTRLLAERCGDPVKAVRAMTAASLLLRLNDSENSTP